MSNWWKGKPVHAIKRGLTSLFVCAVVLLPLAFWGMQIKNVAFGPSDPRTASALPALQTRPIDATNAPLKPFDEPLITVTFDDGWETVYTQAMPLLQKQGIPTTQYILSGVEDDHNYLSFKQLQAIQQAGHEIACHSIDHPDLTKLNQADLKDQLTGCKSVLEQKLHISVQDFASPYGAINATTTSAIKQVYRSSRNTNGDIITNQADDQDVNVRAHFDPYNITAVTLRGDTSVKQLQAAIDYTVKNNGWLVLNYHQVDDADGSKFALTDQLLNDQLAAVSKSPARAVTLGQFMDAYAKQAKR